MTDSTISVSIESLSPEHFSSFTKSLSRILSTCLAVRTYAQVIDGLPTRQVWRQYPGYMHDPINEHRDLCPGVEDTTKAFLRSFDPVTLRFRATAYQNTVPGTTGFKLRLLEMLAISCHEVAATLFQNVDGGLHKEAQSWEPDPALLESRGFYYIDRPAVIFHHEDYDAYEQYPRGKADMVGFWAEYQLFGGVVLFDRGESETECKAAFIHPVQRRRVFKISDSQLDRFIDDVLSDNQEGELDSIPFTAEQKAYRVDAYDAMAWLHIFRERWERKLPPKKPHCCVRRVEEYPEDQAMLDWIRKHYSS